MRALFVALVLLAAPAVGNSNPLTEECASFPFEDGRVCRSLDAGVDGAARVCRNAGGVACEAADGEAPASIEAYLLSATHRALVFQFHLGDGLPLGDAVFPSTHNSFNAEAYAPTLSGLDANQRFSIYDQLRMDIRAIELDVHWWPNVTTADRQPVMCHAEDVGGGMHGGCTNERIFADGLGELRRFLHEQPDEVVLLYVEDHLDGREGYDRAAADLQSALGDRIFKPAARGCASGRPLDVSRADVLAAQKQVIVVSGCGSAAWSDLVFDYDTNNVQGGAESFTAYPACGRDASVYATKWVRFWEDATWLTHMASGPQAEVTPEVAREMTRCPVNMPGFDFLAPDDGRLDALVWSWAEAEPSGSGCVAQSREGRFVVLPCGASHPFACRTESGWTVVDGLDGCAFDVPRTGNDQQRLLQARAGVDEPVWVALWV